jgi:hypothetical protein
MVARDPSTRARVLAAIIGLEGQLAMNLAELRKLGWDGDVDLAILTREHARHLLDRFLSDQLSATECQQWAEALEAREDVGFEAAYEDQLKRLVFELANPELAEPLTPRRATTLSAVLGPAERFPRLYSLFAGYFHQDWSLDHGTTDDVLRTYVADQPESTVRATHDELRELLSLDLSDVELERVLDPGLRSDFTASDIGGSNTAWLQSIADQLRRALAEGHHSQHSR